MPIWAHAPDHAGATPAPATNTQRLEARRVPHKDDGEGSNLSAATIEVFGGRSIAGRRPLKPSIWVQIPAPDNAAVVERYTHCVESAGSIESVRVRFPPAVPLVRESRYDDDSPARRRLVCSYASLHEVRTPRPDKTGDPLMDAGSTPVECAIALVAQW